MARGKSFPARRPIGRWHTSNRHSETFVDRLYSAVSAIFVSIPIRVHEVLQLRVDCEVFEKGQNPDTGKWSMRTASASFRERQPSAGKVGTDADGIRSSGGCRAHSGNVLGGRSVAAWYEATQGSCGCRTTQKVPGDRLVAEG